MLFDNRCGSHLDGSLQADILAGSSHQDLKASALNQEILRFHIIISEASLIQFKNSFLLLARLQRKLLETFQLLIGADDIGLAVMDIELDNLFSGNRSRIFHFHSHRCFFLICHALPVYSNLLVGEIRIAETMAKAEQRFHLAGIIVAVTDEDSFPVFHMIAFAREI